MFSQKSAHSGGLVSSLLSNSIPAHFLFSFSNFLVFVSNRQFLRLYTAQSEDLYANTCNWYLSHLFRFFINIFPICPLITVVVWLPSNSLQWSYSILYQVSLKCIWNQSCEFRLYVETNSLFTELFSPPSVSNKHTQHPSIAPHWYQWWSSPPSQWDSSQPCWLYVVCVIELTLASNRTARRPLRNTRMCRAQERYFLSVI